MAPLLFRDGLHIPYALVFFLFAFLYRNLQLNIGHRTVSGVKYGSLVLLGLVFVYIAFIVLHIAYLYIKPPERYPDLWTVLISLLSCVVFCLSWVFGNTFQILCLKLPVEKSSNKKTD